MKLNSFTRDLARENTAAQECPFQGIVAVKTTTTETRDFARREETVKDAPIGAKHLSVEIGVKPAKGFPC